ncbi:MAG: nitroreductase family protein [Phycisphaerales bacterium]
MAESQTFVPFTPYDPGCSPTEASAQMLAMMQARRSVRFFSDRPVERTVIENIVATAGTAPSGAHKQPWRFVAVQDPEIKRQVRVAAEEEEKAFYSGRASERWLQDLAPFGTNSEKPYLEVCPWLIVVFKLVRDDRPDADSDQVYYVNESVGIATGMLISAIHNAGLSTLTHTPSPMKFLAEVLGRPEYERPYLLLPIGYPADDCVVPELDRKPLDEILVVDRGEG